MIVSDNTLLAQRLSVERGKLDQSLQLYRLAVAHRLDYEIKPAHKRMLLRQRNFQSLYEQMNVNGYG